MTYSKSTALLLMLLLLMFFSPSRGQSGLRKYPKYLMVHFQDGHTRKVLLNNNFIRVKLKKDGDKVYGPFLVDSNFIYTATDTVLFDSIMHFNTFQPGKALVGLVAIVPGIVISSVLASYMISNSSGPLTWVIAFSPAILPALFTLTSFRRHKMMDDVQIEGRNRYPWRLMKEKVIIHK